MRNENEQSLNILEYKKRRISLELVYLLLIWPFYWVMIRQNYLEDVLRDTRANVILIISVYVGVIIAPYMVTMKIGGKGIHPGFNRTTEMMITMSRIIGVTIYLRNQMLLEYYGWIMIISILLGAATEKIGKMKNPLIYQVEKGKYADDKKKLEDILKVPVYIITGEENGYSPWIYRRALVKKIVIPEVSIQRGIGSIRGEILECYIEAASVKNEIYAIPVIAIWMSLIMEGVMNYTMRGNTAYMRIQISYLIMIIMTTIFARGIEAMLIRRIKKKEKTYG